jgi:hypothetical protein
VARYTALEESINSASHEEIKALLALASQHEPLVSGKDVHG